MMAVVMRRVCLAGTLCATLLVAACAPYRVQETDPSLAVEPFRELVETPFFPQDQYQCGPASLATVLNAAGAGVSPQQLQPLVYLPGSKGSLQAEMLAAASHYGYLAVPVPPALDSLLQELSAVPLKGRESGRQGDELHTDRKNNFKPEGTVSGFPLLTSSGPDIAEAIPQQNAD